MWASLGHKSWDTSLGTTRILDGEISSSLGIKIGPDVAIGSSTLRGWGEWDVATLRGGTGTGSGFIIRNWDKASDEFEEDLQGSDMAVCERIDRRAWPWITESIENVLDACKD